MRTAKEWRREIGDQCGSRAGIYTDEEITTIQDEATAHGMTISAGIVDSYLNTEEIQQARHEILTARDNKVWRKE